MVVVLKRAVTANAGLDLHRIGYEGIDIPVPVGPSGLGAIAQGVLDRIQAIQTGKIDHPWSVVAGKAAN